MSTTNIFNAAIESHVQWKIALKKHIEGGEQQDVTVVANCKACDLGGWIYDEGYRYNRLPSFETMCAAHEQFHRAAAEIVHYSNRGETHQAKALLSPNGAFSQTSARLIKAIMDCSRELSLHLEKGAKGPIQVRDILKTKQDEKIYSIGGAASVMDAIHMMVSHNIGSLAVYKDGDGEMAGIFTERGLLKNLAHKGASMLDASVADMVDPGIVYIHPEDSVEQCMVLMTSAHTRHLPVLDNGKLAGIISIGDVVKKVSSEGDDKISMLESYIHGSYGAT